jgi:hypothetical protein
MFEHVTVASASQKQAAVRLQFFWEENIKQSVRHLAPNGRRVACTLIGESEVPHSFGVRWRSADGEVLSTTTAAASYCTTREEPIKKKKQITF